MATTKRAQYLFRVSEFAPEIREGSVAGTLRIAPVPFISTECRGVGGEQDVLEGDLLGFDLQNGTSMEKAEEIADFLNENLLSIAITRFGDAEDAAREVKQSEHVREIDIERFSMVVGTLREKLALGDVPAAIEAMTAVQSVIAGIISGWSKANALSQEILDKFGEGGDRDAT
jgi:hypothetical protein